MLQAHKYENLTFFMKSVILKLLEPSGPLQVCTGIALNLAAQ